MLQASLSDSLLLDLFPYSRNRFVTPKVYICACDVVQVLVATLIVVAINEGPDLVFWMPSKLVIFSRTRFFMVRHERSILTWV